MSALKKPSSSAKKKSPAKKAAAKKPAVKKPAVKKASVSKSKPATAVKPPVVKLSPGESEQRVRVRAYEIYLTGRNNNHLADWFEAEAELRSLL